MARVRRNFRGNKIKIDKKKIAIFVLILLFVVMMLILLVRIGYYKKKLSEEEQKNSEETLIIAEEKEKEQEEDQKTQERQEEQQAEEEETLVNQIDMTILGNVLCDSEVYKSVYSNDEYDFSSIFKNVQSYTEEADITIAGMEANFYTNQYEGKSKYNTPQELAKALSNIGVNVVNAATNHSFDYGIDGVNSTISTLNENDIDVAGLKNEEHNGAVIKNVNGLKIAFLSYTYGLNGVSQITEEQSNCINFIDKEQMKKDIESVKAEGAEYICVTLHWQTSSNYTVTEEQKELADYLSENGADIIIGTHPNEVEKMKVKQNSDGKDVLIIYSTGDFISAQSDVGIILQVQIKKQTQGESSEVWLSQVKYHPIYIYKNNGKYEILDAKATIEKYDSGDTTIVTKATYNKLKKAVEEIETRIGNK